MPLVLSPPQGRRASGAPGPLIQTPPARSCAASRLGRELGWAGIEGNTEEKTVTITF